MPTPAKSKFDKWKTMTFGKGGCTFSTDNKVRLPFMKPHVYGVINFFQTEVLRVFAWQKLEGITRCEAVSAAVLYVWAMASLMGEQLESSFIRRVRNRPWMGYSATRVCDPPNNLCTWDLRMYTTW